MKTWVIQSKHFLSEELLENIWRRSSAPDECFSDWRRRPRTNLGVFSSDFIFFWANWLYTNKGLIPVFDLSVVGEPIEWRTVEERSSESEVGAIESRLNNLAARLAQLKQRRT